MPSSDMPRSESINLDNLRELTRKVQSRPVTDQTRLVMTLADAYARFQGPQTIHDKLGAVFVELVRVVEHDVRRGLSRRLGSADWLPVELARALARDEIEIATPVISASPLLNENDLLQLLATATTEHRLQVALRPGLAAKVSQAILDSNEPLLLTALASNIYAQLPEDGLERLVDASQNIVGIRQPLTLHPDLDETLAERLYRWVASALQDALCDRFPHHADKLKLAMSDTVQQLQDARIAMQMHDSGRLTPASLMRFVRENRHTLFLQSLCLLAEIRTDELDFLIRRPSARHFYLACLAAGIDRAAFPDVLEGLRRQGMTLPPPLLDSELRLGERDRYQAKLELRAIVDCLGNTPSMH